MSPFGSSLDHFREVSVFSGTLCLANLGPAAAGLRHVSPFGSSLGHFRELLEVTGVRFLPNLRAAGVHLD